MIAYEADTGIAVAHRGRLSAGQAIAPRVFSAIDGTSIAVPDTAGLIHLQFRRFAGCPVCNLHLRSVMRRHDEIRSAGITEIAFFHSRAGDLRPYVADMPFAVVADPKKHIYAEFGVEAAPRALLSRHAVLPILRGVGRALIEIAQGKPVPPLNAEGGRLGLPADFLIAPDGRIAACHYGEHVYDQWSVDELLAHARRAA